MIKIIAQQIYENLLMLTMFVANADNDRLAAVYEPCLNQIKTIEHSIKS